MADSIKEPWILARDFNCIWDSSERSVELLYRKQDASGFRSFYLIMASVI